MITPTFGPYNEFTLLARIKFSNTGLQNIFSGSLAAWYPSTSNGDIRWYDGVNWRLSSSILNDSEWHEIAFVFENGVHRIYIDGLFEYQADEGTYSEGTITTIGSINYHNQRFFEGEIDMVKIYSQALTENEIEESFTEHFNSSLTLFSGQIGIGTPTPSDKLDIHQGGVVLSTPNQSISDGTNLNGLKWIVEDNSSGRISEEAAAIKFLGTGTWNGSASPSLLSFETIGTAGGGTVQRMIIDSQGNVGIGTQNTFGYRLAVNGTIGSTEVKVENTSAWPDFVFEKDYELLTLQEVEQHISEKGHLPEIPSEEEVTENGINLGEMDAKLLMKIEELTLYMIDINKRVNQLEQENSELKENNKELRKEIFSLKSN